MKERYEIDEQPPFTTDFDLDTEDEIEYDHDDQYDVDSGLGSAGWGTDEWYDSYDSYDELF